MHLLKINNLNEAPSLNFQSGLNQPVYLAKFRGSETRNEDIKNIIRL